MYVLCYVGVITLWFVLVTLETRTPSLYHVTVLIYVLCNVGVITLWFVLVTLETGTPSLYHVTVPIGTDSARHSKEPFSPKMFK